MDEDPKYLREIIMSGRRKRGITQEEMAARLGVPHSGTYGNFERGSTNRLNGLPWTKLLDLARQWEIEDRDTPPAIRDQVEVPINIICMGCGVPTAGCAFHCMWCGHTLANREDPQKLALKILGRK